MHPIVTMHWYSLVCQHCSRDLEFIRTGQPSGTIWSRRLKYCKGSGLDNWNHLEPSFHLLPCMNAFSKYPILLTNRDGFEEFGKLSLGKSLHSLHSPIELVTVTEVELRQITPATRQAIWKNFVFLSSRKKKWDPDPLLLWKVDAGKAWPFLSPWKALLKYSCSL